MRAAGNLGRRLAERGGRDAVPRGRGVRLYEAHATPGVPAEHR
jgi:hypothetical protein